MTTTRFFKFLCFFLVLPGGLCAKQFVPYDGSPIKLAMNPMIGGSILLPQAGVDFIYPTVEGAMEVLIRKSNQNLITIIASQWSQSDTRHSDYRLIIKVKGQQGDILYQFEVVPNFEVDDGAYEIIDKRLAQKITQAGLDDASFFTFIKKEGFIPNLLAKYVIEPVLLNDSRLKLVVERMYEMEDRIFIYGNILLHEDSSPPVVLDADKEGDNIMIQEYYNNFYIGQGFFQFYGKGLEQEQKYPVYYQYVQ